MRRLWPGAAATMALVALAAVFYRELIFTGLVLGDYDAFVYFYPLRQYAAEMVKQGTFPLWNPFLFVGAPFFANLQTAVLYPPNALFLWLPTPYAYTASIVLHVLLAGISMYIFSARSLGLSTLPALVAAIAFMFSGYISGQMGHINQFNVSAWLPLLLAAFDESLRRRSPALVIGTGVIGTLQFLAGHTQEWYFSTATLGLFALWRVVDLPATAALSARSKPLLGQGSLLSMGLGPVPRRLIAGESQWEVPNPGSALQVGQGKTPNPLSAGQRPESSVRSRIRPLVYLLLAGLVEVGLTAAQVLPTMELSQQSIRGGGMSYGEAVSFSLPVTTAIFTLLPTYPVTLFSEYVGYVGVVPLVLAAGAVVAWASRPVTVFMALLAAFGLFMALGGYNPVYPLLYHWIPGLDLFRVPARWLLVYTFGVAGLAGLGAQVALDLGERVPGWWSRGRRTHPGEMMVAMAVPQSFVARLRLSACALLPFLAAAAALSLALTALGLFFVLSRPKPSLADLQTWGALTGLTLGLVSLASLGRRTGWVSLGLLAMVVVGELWAAGGSVASRQPIPYEAFTPTRASTSALLEDAATRGPAPGRLLSFATDKYEVKETPDYKLRYGWLDHESLFKFLVDVKLSETLSANIPMEYGIETVDGYDGGILPLKRYVGLKNLVIPGPEIPPDNMLRLNLRYAPPMRLLDLLNVRYVLGTKLQDTEVDNVYYDRAFSIVLEPGQPARLRRLPDLKATSIGVISSTEGAREMEDGTVVAKVIATDASGFRYELPLRMGIETGETPERDREFRPPSHRKPRVVQPWSPETSDADYYARLSLPLRTQIKDLTLEGLLPQAKVRIRAMTIIDDVAGIPAPLVLSDRLDRQIFFDTKLYVVADPIPRAFVVHNSIVREDGAALEALRRPQLSLDQTVVLAPSDSATAIYRSSLPGFDPGEARLKAYSPEMVSLDVAAKEDGYLVLLDAYYPGWVAEVDGARVPIERANYFFRALFVERGEHTVVFRYDPPSFQTGMRVTLFSLGLVLGVLLFLAGRWWRRRHERVI